MSNRESPMVPSDSRVDQLKARLDSILDAKSLPPAKPNANETAKQTTYGITLLLLAALILISGTYLSPHAGIARSLLEICALVLAVFGAVVILRAYRTDGPSRDRSS